MASKPIQPLVLDSIGIYGLNRQSSASSLPPQFLTTANNIMLDEKGRVTTREGIKQVTDNVHTGSLDVNGNPTANTLIVKSLGEYISATGAKTLFAGAGANIYKINTANTPYTLDAQTFGGSATTKMWKVVRVGQDPENKDITAAGVNMVVVVNSASNLYIN